MICISIIDIHECKFPMAYQPNYVKIFHNGELVFTDKINFDNITGQVIIDVTSKKHIFNEISDSPAKFVQFKFIFLKYDSLSMLGKNSSITFRKINEIYNWYIQWGR